MRDVNTGMEELVGFPINAVDVNVAADIQRFVEGIRSDGIRNRPNTSAVTAYRSVSLGEIGREERNYDTGDK